MYYYVLQFALSESGSECLDRRTAALKLFFHSRRNFLKAQPAGQRLSALLGTSRFQSQEMCVGPFPHFKKRYREHHGHLPIQKAHFKYLPSQCKAPRLPAEPISAQETSPAFLLLSLGLQQPPQNPNPTGRGPKALSRTLLPIPRRTA